MNKSHKVISCLIVAVTAISARADYSDACLEVSGAAPECRVLGNRRVYIFTDTSAAVSVTTKKALTLEETLVVGGGGGGGGGIGGGGGGGGVVRSDSPRTVAEGATFTVTIGAGGTSQSAHCVGGFGGHSILDWGDGSPIRAFGGGGGAGYSKALTAAAVVNEVGSGGGIGQGNSTGTEGTQWKQGNKGMSMREPLTGGGGGAGCAAPSENGGEGLAFDITGDRVVYGSGGGGGSRKDKEKTYAGRGGTNAGDGSVDTDGTAGVAGTGGGGGGGGYSPAYAGGKGGSGTVILAFTEHDPAGVRFTVAPIVDQLFHDAAVTPSVTVLDADGQEISSGFTVSYENNEAVGSARAIVSGAEGSAYEGYTAVMPFAIRQVRYSDDYIEATDETICKKVVSGYLTYVFTNTAENVLFVPKTLLTLEKYLLVGGGGSGGCTRGAGGGGGGVILSSQAALMSASSPCFVTVGAGGRYGVGSSSKYGSGRAGGASSLIGPGIAETAFGGGGGAGYNLTCVDVGPFGSGGGGTGGAKTSYTAGQGFSGAARTGELGGGGGGASEEGSGSHGGEGVLSVITGDDVVYGSGGGGSSSTAGGEGGTNAGDGAVEGGESGVDGTGGGGGGGGGNNKVGGRGGTGIAVLSFLVGDHVHYRDEFILTDDLTVRRIDKSDSVVYVFTNTVATQVVQVLKQMRIKRALLVGGGGSGGTVIGGGGGGGGVVFENRVNRKFEKGEEFSVRVGAGALPTISVSGTVSVRYPAGKQGEHSSLTAEGLSLIAYGGGGGAGFSVPPTAAAVPDEIGSGGGSSNRQSAGTEGSAWKQGNKGGAGSGDLGGGGGGMNAAGQSYVDTVGGHGGEGVTNLITGVAVVYGSGGGGGTRSDYTGGTGGTNAGNGNNDGVGYPGVDGTGGGGGGGGYGSMNFEGGKGGCGTVILEVTPVKGLLLILR